MPDDASEAGTPPKQSSKMPIIIGFVLAIAGGGSGFFAVQSGLVLGEPSEELEHTETAVPTGPSMSYVAIDPLVISLPSSNGRDHLRFSAQLEVPPAHAAEVEAVKPRIVDVLNSYLRAVDLAELEDPTSLARLRSQMLRRIQVVTGDGRVADLLIMEFVLS